MGNSVIIRKNQFKQSADTVTFDILLQGEKKQGFLVWFEGVFKAYVKSMPAHGGMSRLAA